MAAIPAGTRAPVEQREVSVGRDGCGSTDSRSGMAIPGPPQPNGSEFCSGTALRHRKRSPICITRTASIPSFARLHTTPCASRIRLRGSRERTM